MTEKIFFLCFVLMITVGCGSATGTSFPPTGTGMPIALATHAPMETSTATQTVTKTSLPTKTATATWTPTLNFTPTPRPTMTATPVVSPIRIGDFVLERKLFDKDNRARVAPREIPILAWLNLSEAESVEFDALQAEYLDVIYAVTRDSYDAAAKKFESSAKTFLGKYSKDDGVIVGHMLAGHGDNWIYLLNDWSDWHNHYDIAIQLLLERHPERLPYLLNDLIDLGLQIYQVEKMDDPTTGDRALLIAFTLPGGFGSRQSQMYSFVQRQGKAWQLLRLPLTDEGGDANYHTIERIADINNDGKLELIVNSGFLYASHYDSNPDVFVLQNGEWKDLVEWDSANYKGAMNGAYNGIFWLEDADGNGVQEIVVSYLDSPGTFVPRIDIYQWDSNRNLYSRDLPIKPHVCGYHAFAEAERLARLKDLKHAEDWYRETRKRWLAEIEQPNELCKQGPEPNSRIVAYTFQRQIEEEDKLSGTDRLATHLLYIGTDIVLLKGGVISNTETITSSRNITVEYTNIFQCRTPDCHSVAHHYDNVTYNEVFTTGNRVVCSSERPPDDGGEYQIEGAKPFILSSRWSCSYRVDGKITVQRNGIEIINVCIWNGERFSFANSRLLRSIVWDHRDGDSYIDKAIETFPRLVDCSGDAPQPP